MTELQTLQHDPNDALLELGPADDDVMQWRAVMRGVDGTAYEGTHKPTAHLHNLHRSRDPVLTSQTLADSIPQTAAGSSPSRSPRSIPSLHPPSAS